MSTKVPGVHDDVVVVVGLGGCRYDKAAADFEQARILSPDDPNLVVNYSRLHEVEVIVLCAAGEEPEFL